MYVGESKKDRSEEQSKWRKHHGKSTADVKAELRRMSRIVSEMVKESSEVVHLGALMCAHAIGEAAEFAAAFDRAMRESLSFLTPA
jgi:hypothetical protein